MLLTDTDSRAIADRLLGFVTADDALVFVQGEEYSHLRFAANTFLTSGRAQRRRSCPSGARTTRPCASRLTRFCRAAGGRGRWRAPGWERASGGEPRPR